MPDADTRVQFIVHALGYCSTADYNQTTSRDVAALTRYF